ncbi:hypothetical protein ACWGB8_29865 [Kitasatospora sp. NPDC054939]
MTARPAARGTGTGSPAARGTASGSPAADRRWRRLPIGRAFALGLALALLPLTTPPAAAAPNADGRISPAAPAAAAGAPGLPAADPEAPDPTGFPAPVQPDSGFPVKVNDDAADYNRRRGELSARATALAAEVKALEQKRTALAAKSADHGTRAAAHGRRVTAHNAKVEELRGRITAHNAKPHVFVLPRQAAEAAAYDAEKAQLDGEKARLEADAATGLAERAELDAEAQRLTGEKARLDTEAQRLTSGLLALQTDLRALEAKYLQLLQDVDHALYNSLRIRFPAKHPGLRGGDPGRAQGRDSRGKYTSGNGGDRVSRRTEQQTLEEYAKRQKVTVDTRQVRARLSPEARAKLTPAEAAKLGEYRKFDGLVLKPNGNYRALEVKTAGAGLDKHQRPFDKAIEEHGGQAWAVVDGKRIVIDEVEIIQG